MVGERQTDRPELFYGFSLERQVPADHLLRRFALDASMIKADANRQNSTPGDEWQPDAAASLKG